MTVEKPESYATQVPGMRARIPSIRRTLILRFFALIVLAFAAFAVGIYFVVVRPAAREIAAGEM